MKDKREYLNRIHKPFPLTGIDSNNIIYTNILWREFCLIRNLLYDIKVYRKNNIHFDSKSGFMAILRMGKCHYE